MADSLGDITAGHARCRTSAALSGGPLNPRVLGSSPRGYATKARATPARGLLLDQVFPGRCLCSPHKPRWNQVTDKLGHAPSFVHFRCEMLVVDKLVDLSLDGSNRDAVRGTCRPIGSTSRLDRRPEAQRCGEGPHRWTSLHNHACRLGTSPRPCARWDAREGLRGRRFVRRDHLSSETLTTSPSRRPRTREA